MSTATATTRREAGVRLQIRQTMFTSSIVIHQLLAWYLVIQTLVTGNCLPTAVGAPAGEVYVPHAVWILALMPVGLFGLLAARHEVEPDPDDYTSYIRLLYFILAVCMVANLTGVGLFGWELYRCATDYCKNKKGFLIGGNIVLHSCAFLLEGVIIALAYLYHRDLLHAIQRGWQPTWATPHTRPPKSKTTRHKPRSRRV